ncbi:hypothetical protein BLOT_008019 [Blomia tropicalis]|nr:hypothetical protein BLOT_008019 [Blomia tropicalis]
MMNHNKTKQESESKTSIDLGLARSFERLAPDEIDFISREVLQSKPETNHYSDGTKVTNNNKNGIETKETINSEHDLIVRQRQLMSRMETFVSSTFGRVNPTQRCCIFNQQTLDRFKTYGLRSKTFP